MNLPTATLTFLFTDIEGSTQLWERHPEPMRQALARHDTLLREAIESNNGVVFKTVGDAFCAAFATATDALTAALAAQRALLTEPWNDGRPENGDKTQTEEPSSFALHVRIALHTGAVERRDNDYFGQPLNRIARLLAIGHGRQVLLSDVTHDLACDTLPLDAALQNLGEHRLRDLGRPETVFQLVHPDLPAEFPPLRSLDNPDLPNNLPLQTTSFVGREKETAEARTLLGKTRLLTLTGSGGCGKTRLALQVAADLLEEYPDGVWLVELAPLNDAALAPQTLASVLRVPEESGEPLLQTLTSALKPRHLLILLDNCEHLLDACAQLAEALIRACPHIKMLATSREGLNIAGETTYRVPSLSMPDPKRATTLEMLTQYEAVRLFIERAEASLPSFAVTNESAPALAGVCHRLDGIPLAIELAAARVRSLSVEEINARLDQRFRLLTGGSRTALPRQQTLRALIDWSYNLLGEPEKALLGRLAVFAGGWTLEAAEAVCGDFQLTIDNFQLQPTSSQIENGKLQIENIEVLDLLTALVDKSLVVAETPGSETRYRLLETVRQYARERLVEREEGVFVRDRHRDYFLTLAEDAKPHLTGAEQARWLERLEIEHDNLRAALAYSTPAEQELRLVGALWWFWYVHGHLSEGRAYLAEALGREGAGGRTKTRATALRGAGVLASIQGDYKAARALFEESLAVRRELGDRWGSASTLTSLGIMASTQGDYEAAKALFDEGLAIRRSLGDKRGVAISLNSLGIMASTQGNYASARALHEESLAIRRALGDKRGITISLDSLGTVAMNQSDYEAAKALFEESLTIKHELGDKRGIASSLNSLGTMAMNQSDYGTARALHKESLAIRRALGDTRGVAVSLNNLGIVASTQGDDEAAKALFEESLTIKHELGDKRGIIESLEAFARLAGQGRPERASRLWGASEALREALGAPLPPSERVEYDRNLAAAREALGSEAFTAAWTAGQGMTIEQAIAYALEEIEA